MHCNARCSVSSTERSGWHLEQDKAGEQLGEDAAEGPDVDLLAIGQAEDDLGRPV